MEYRIQSGNACGNRYRDRQDVISKKRNASHLGGDDAEVVFRDDVCTACGGVGLNGLSITENQNGEHEHHGDRDREHKIERHASDASDKQRKKNFF